MDLDIRVHRVKAVELLHISLSITDAARAVDMNRSYLSEAVSRGLLPFHVVPPRKNKKVYLDDVQQVEPRTTEIQTQAWTEVVSHVSWVGLDVSSIARSIPIVKCPTCWPASMNGAQ